MNIARMHLKVCLLTGCIALLAAQPLSGATGGDEITAVSSRASGDYVRQRLPDGSFQPETYAFGEGGRWTGAMNDATLDNLSFLDVARTIAVPLGDEHYVPTRDAKTTKLLILVYWGRTTTPGAPNDSVPVQQLQRAASSLAAAKSTENQQLASANNSLDTSDGMACGHFAPVMASGQIGDVIGADNTMTSAMAVVSAANRNRDQIDARNALMLGYDSLWSSTENLKGTPLEYRRQDMVTELEESRYFVVVMAYDFQKMWKEKKHKLLWETRVSVCQRRHNFDKDLLAMTQYASQYFGQDSHGLIRKVLPEGRVDIGELKALGATETER